MSVVLGEGVKSFVEDDQELERELQDLLNVDSGTLALFPASVSNTLYSRQSWAWN